MKQSKSIIIQGPECITVFHGSIPVICVPSQLPDRSFAQEAAMAMNFFRTDSPQVQFISDHITTFGFKKLEARLLQLVLPSEKIEFDDSKVNTDKIILAKYTCH